ncbi:MAG: tryptophan synthase subunit alpha [Bacteroidetes bacterium]|nr:MAG: tryptophan synthase subunit alpha [Bacteroidota bacterium]
MKIKEVLLNNEGILNIFYTAGYPQLKSTVQIAQILDRAGIKMVEIGMPYSDPLADGETIQHSSERALNNGMNMDIMFTQVKEISATTDLAINLMGYFNQLLTVGVEQFLKSCKESGVSGLIIPDLPMEIYDQEYKNLFEENEIAISFLITPGTSLERVKLADQLSTGFLYLVADNSITGSATGTFSDAQIAYFERIRNCELKSPALIGFGIKTENQYQLTRKYANGAIIGSEFIRKLSASDIVNEENLKTFIKSIVNN